MTCTPHISRQVRCTPKSLAGINVVVLDVEHGTRVQDDRDGQEHHQLACRCAKLRFGKG